MGVRSARISDLLAIRTLAADSAAQVLGSPLPGDSPSPVGLLLRGWYSGMANPSRTMVVGRGGCGRGFAQATARPGRESWDVVRLACLAPDPQSIERVCSELLGRICAVAAQSGALRTFARAPAEDGDRLSLLTRHSFRPYATEITHVGSLWPLVQAAPDPGPDVRMRLPRDGWDVFSLYCALTPAMVRHAESRSLREWTLPPTAATARPACPSRPARGSARGAGYASCLDTLAAGAGLATAAAGSADPPRCCGSPAGADPLRRLRAGPRCEFANTVPNP